MRKLFWLLLFVAGNVLAATRYASPTGVGSGSCLTTGTACTMAYAVSIMGDNDTTIALVGTYTDPAAVTAPAACTTLCTFRAETEAECNTRGGSSCSSGVVITKTSGTFFSVGNNHHRWEIKGFILYNYSSGFGFASNNGSNHIYFTDLTYYAADPTAATGEGVRVGSGGDDIIVTNFTARHDPRCLNTCGSSPADCDYQTNNGALISIVGGATNVIVQDSHFGYIRNSGIIRDVTGLTIRRNVGTNCVNHGCFELSDVKDVVVENNVMNFDLSGVCSDAYNQGDFIDTYCWENVTIRNNTLVSHGVGPNTLLYHFASSGARAECNNGVGPEVMDDDGFEYENEAVYNNILYDTGTSAISSPSSVSIACIKNQLDRFSSATTPGYYENYNVIYSCAASGDKIGYTADSFGPYNWADYKTNASASSAADNVEANGFNSTPVFVTYSADGGLFGINDDLRLAAGSPAADAGINSGSYTCPTDDIEKATRTGTCDIGAYTYTASGGGGSTRRRAHITVPKK